MKKWLLIALAITTTCACGYKLVDWHSELFATIGIPPVSAEGPARSLAPRLHDALIERCLAGSSLQPVKAHDADLVLKSRLNGYRENIIATDSDGRTKRVQFTMNVTFELWRGGTKLWSLSNYQYADQFQVSTTQVEYRNESIYVQDQAMDAVAELVAANVALVIQELEESETR